MKDIILLVLCIVSLLTMYQATQNYEKANKTERIYTMKQYSQNNQFKKMIKLSNKMSDDELIEALGL